MTTTPETRVQRHPVRGFFYGLLLGIGAAIYLVLFSVTPFRIATMVAVIVIGGLFGALWGSVAPAKKLTEVPPATAAFGTTYVSTADVDRGPSPTYEETFGRPAPTDEDNGAFGAPGDDAAGDDGAAASDPNGEGAVAGPSGAEPTVS